MFRLSSTHRIVLGLVALTVSALLVCGMLGLIPGIQQTESISRQGFCETTAVSFMALAPRMDQDSPEQTLEQLKERRSDVQSVGVRRADGEIVMSSANHVDLWESTGDNPANECEFIVPIRAENELWGALKFISSRTVASHSSGFRSAPTSPSRPLWPSVCLALLRCISNASSSI